MIIAAWTINVHSPDVITVGDAEEQWLLTDKRLLADLPAMLEAVEEDLRDLMPQGYSVSITPYEESSDERVG